MALTARAIFRLIDPRFVSSTASFLAVIHGQFYYPERTSSWLTLGTRGVRSIATSATSVQMRGLLFFDVVVGSGFDAGLSVRPTFG